MFAQPKSATRRSSHFGACLAQGCTRPTLFAVGLTLLLLTCQVHAAQTTVTWDDPNNYPAQVAGYQLYYWQTTGQTPTSLDVGKQTTYTLTGLAAGQTYSFAVTAYNSAVESADSNVISQTFPATAPVASFSATPSTGTVPLNVTFASTSTGTITTWAWTFGDGSTSTASTPSYTYTAVGTYTVRLTVTGPDGTDTATATVTVAPAPGASLVAAYSFNEVSGTTAFDASGNGNNGTLTNGAVFAPGKNGNAVSLDGVNDFVTLGNSPSLQLTGSMTISAWINASAFPVDDAAVVSKRGNTLAGYQLDTTIDTGPRTIGFKLTNASGSKMSRYGATVLQVNQWSHIAGVYNAATQTLDVYLNGQLNNGALVGSVTASQQNSTLNAAIGRKAGNTGFEFAGKIDDVRIYNRALTQAEIQTDMNTPVSGTPPTTDTTPPTVAITAPGAGATVSGTTTVTATAADNIGVVGVQFLLDGVNLGSEDTTAPYSTAWDTTTATNGTHSLAAMARDAAGNRAIAATVTVTVSNLLPSPPVANFNAAPTTGLAPLPAQFTDASTGSISTWAWSFGDGTSSTAQNPPHTYSTAGTYSASLTVTGPGGSATTATSITVTLPPPVANFNAAPTTGLAPLPAQFTDASTGSVSTWAWSFGDGSSSSAQNPQHTYSTAGTYSASLTVTGPGGSSTTATSISVTLPPPVANFSATPTTGPPPLSVQSTDASTGSISTWAWRFGDGTSSTARSPLHLYSATGRYTVSLTVSGPGGTNTVTKTNYITVTTNPTGLVAAYSFDEGSGTTVTDVSDNSNKGTISGATWTTAGKSGGALSFNGTTNWVTVNDDPSLDLTNRMTLEAWVYPTVRPKNWSTVIMKEQPGEFVYVLYAGSPASRPAVFFNVSTSSKDERGITGSSALPTNTWSHLAGTYDGTTLRLYVNGTLVTSQAFAGPIATSNGALRIGGNSVWGEYFQGRIDEVRIYNRALSASEIQADMQTPINALASLAPVLP